MQVTEVMIFSFVDKVPVSTILLEGSVATVTLTEPGADGGEVVRKSWERPTSALADVRDVVRELSVVPPQ